MQNFFSKSYTRMLSRVYKINLTPKNPNKEPYYFLSEKFTKSDFRSPKFLNLLPKEDLLIYLSEPCPVVNEKSDKNEELGLAFKKGLNTKQITHSKKLRKSLGIRERDVCSRCPIKSSCHLVD